MTWYVRTNPLWFHCENNRPFPPSFLTCTPFQGDHVVCQRDLQVLFFNAGNICVFRSIVTAHFESTGRDIGLMFGLRQPFHDVGHAFINLRFELFEFLLRYRRILAFIEYFLYQLVQGERHIGLVVVL